MTDQSDAAKPTEDWVTGDEPMTGPQRSSLETLTRGTGADGDPRLVVPSASGKPGSSISRVWSPTRWTGPMATDPSGTEVPPPHRPLRPDEPPTPILPDPGEPAPLVPDPMPAQPEPTTRRVPAGVESAAA